MQQRLGYDVVHREALHSTRESHHEENELLAIVGHFGFIGRGFFSFVVSLGLLHFLIADHY